MKKKIVWVPASHDGVTARAIVRAHVVAQPDKKLRGLSHRLATVWVGKRGAEYLVLQCERVLDYHRVLGTCTSAFAAYLLRGQLEALQRLARDAGPDAKGARSAARATGVRLPAKT